MRIYVFIHEKNFLFLLLIMRGLSSCAYLLGLEDIKNHVWRKVFLDRWWIRIVAQTSQREISGWTAFTGTFVNMLAKLRVMISTSKEPLTLRNSHTSVSRWELSSDYSAKRERYKSANTQRYTTSFEFSSTNLAPWSVLSLRNQLRNNAKMWIGIREFDLLGFPSLKHSAKGFRNILSPHKLHSWRFWRTTSRHHCTNIDGRHETTQWSQHWLPIRWHLGRTLRLLKSTFRSLERDIDASSIYLRPHSNLRQYLMACGCISGVLRWWWLRYWPQTYVGLVKDHDVGNSESYFGV